jgi:hypothetical protein
MTLSDGVERQVVRRTTSESDIQDRQPMMVGQAQLDEQEQVCASVRLKKQRIQGVEGIGKKANPFMQKSIKKYGRGMCFCIMW